MSGGGLWNSDNSLCDGYGRVQIEGLAGEREEGRVWRERERKDFVGSY